MTKRIICVLFILALVFLMATPSICQDKTQIENVKNTYFQLIKLLGAIFILLLIWELTDWAARRKRESIDAAREAEAVSVVEEEHEEDPFKTLLREESTSAKTPVELPVVEEEKVPVVLKIEEEVPQVEEYRPSLSDEVLVPKEKEKPKKVVHVDVPFPEQDLMVKASKGPQAPAREQPMTRTAESTPISENGWRELMMKAAEDSEKPEGAPAKEEAKAASQPVLTPLAYEPQEDEEDPWKALLRKSKQEEVGKKEEEKPWSVFLKSEKSKRADSSQGENLDKSSEKEEIQKLSQSESESDILPPLEKDPHEIAMSVTPANEEAIEEAVAVGFEANVETAPVGETEEATADAAASDVIEGSALVETEEVKEKMSVPESFAAGAAQENKLEEKSGTLSTPGKKRKTISLATDEAPGDAMKGERKDSKRRTLDLGVGKRKDEVLPEISDEKKKVPPTFTRKTSKIISISDGSKDGTEEPGGE